MANLSVTCPNCGSSQCHEYRADSFICSHCDTTFRWTDPNRITVRHESQTCQCGRKPIGACTQCRTGVCRDHMATWRTLFNCWQKLKEAYAEGRKDLRTAVIDQGGMSNVELQRPMGWLHSTQMDYLLNGVCRQQHHCCNIDDNEIDLIKKNMSGVVGNNEDVLCFNCTEASFAKLLQPVETAVRRLVDQRKLCKVECQYEGRGRIVTIPLGLCAECGVPVPPLEGDFCRDCGKVWCKSHLNFREGICRSCRPSLLRRIFS